MCTCSSGWVVMVRAKTGRLTEVAGMSYASSFCPFLRSLVPTARWPPNTGMLDFLLICDEV